MEYRIKTEIDNAFYEVHVQLSKWIKRDGNKNDQVIRATYKGLEVYYRGYIEAKKNPMWEQKWRGRGISTLNWWSGRYKKW